MAIGHVETAIAAKAPTCTETGLTAGKKCSVCGEVTKAQTTVAALGHAETTIAGKAATCTETGLTAGKKCTVCGTVTVAQETVAAKGHTEVEVPAVEATCKDTGLTAGKKCSVCNTVTVAQTETAKKTTHVYDDEFDATCNVCDHVRNVNCKHANVETLAAVPATCKDAGLKEGKKCKDCGETIVAQETVPATGQHTEVTVPGKAATCKDTGLTDGKKCSACNTVTVAQTEIAKKDHAWVAATCTAPKTCSTCNATEGAALGHNWTNASCTAPKTCSTCKTTEGAALGHKYDNDLDATCNTCGATREIEECAHANIETIPTVVPTCTSTGLTEGKKCKDCGETVVPQTEIAKKSHTWAAATCNTAKTCAVCKTEEGTALGHDWKDANCVTPKTCTRCRATEGSALGHTIDRTAGKYAPYVEPTCSTVGQREGGYCGVCGNYVQSVQIPMSDHTYDANDVCSVCSITRAEAEKDPTYVACINAINGLGPNGSKWNINNYYGSKFSPNSLNPNVVYTLPIAGDAFDYYCRTFTLTGWAILDNGQGDMYWSDDGGKTWKAVDYQFFVDGNENHDPHANLLNVKNYSRTNVSFVVTIDLSGYADDEFVEICVGRAAGNGTIVNIFKFNGLIVGDEERETILEPVSGVVSRDDASNPVSIVSFDQFNSLAGVTDFDFRTDRLRVGIKNGIATNLGNDAAWQTSDRVIRILKSDVTTAGNLFQIEGWVKLDHGERDYELSLNVYRSGSKVWSKNTTDDCTGDTAHDAHLRETIFFKLCSPDYRSDIYNAAQGPSAFYSAKLDASILKDGDFVHFVLKDKVTGVEYGFNYFVIKIVDDNTDLTVDLLGTLPTK